MLKAAKVAKMSASGSDLALCYRRKAPSTDLAIPAPAPACGSLDGEFGGRIGAALPVSAPVDCTERYSTVLRCGGATLLFRRAEARRGPTIHHDYWWSVVRVARDGGFGPSSVSLPAALNLSHNTAFACSADGQRVVAYGGRRKFLRFRDIDIREAGIHVAIGTVVTHGSSVTLHWSRPRLALSGLRGTGCVERRSRVGPDCEFDGKLSVASWRGRTYLYARANVAECGGRHVQMTWARCVEAEGSKCEALTIRASSALAAASSLLIAARLELSAGLRTRSHRLC